MRGYDHSAFCLFPPAFFRHGGANFFYLTLIMRFISDQDRLVRKVEKLIKTSAPLEIGWICNKNEGASWITDLMANSNK
jgi:hypothetical protein